MGFLISDIAFLWWCQWVAPAFTAWRLCILMIREWAATLQFHKSQEDSESCQIYHLSMTIPSFRQHPPSKPSCHFLNSSGRLNLGLVFGFCCASSEFVRLRVIKQIHPQLPTTRSVRLFPCRPSYSFATMPSRSRQGPNCQVHSR